MRRQLQGFTLIEVLVVVFIIGVILGFATLSLGGRSLDDRLEQDATRLHRVLELALEEAVLTTTEIGFATADEGYVFVVRGEDGWQPLEASRGPLRAHRFDYPAKIEMQDLPAALATAAAEDEGPRPVALLLSSGELSPFTLLLSAPGVDRRYRISGRPDGLLQRTAEPLS